MSADRVEQLLEKLCNGDEGAAEEVFRTYEPYLRKVVRRQLTPALQSKFDSHDVVQSVWANVLRGFRSGGWRFRDANHLRAFLVRATQNRFIDRIRHHGNAIEHEQALTDDLHEMVPSTEPRPSEQAQARDLWQLLLARCPPKYRELLLLKREGLTASEIAERSGLHPHSVRRILRELARDVAVAGPEDLESVP